MVIEVAAFRPPRITARMRFQEQIQERNGTLEMDPRELAAASRGTSALILRRNRKFMKK